MSKGRIVLAITAFLAGLSFVLLLSPSADADEVSDTLSQFERNVTFTTLSNGLRVILYHRGIAPTFAGVVGVRVGGTDEQPGHTGIAHMFEHMAFKGTSTIGTRDYKLERQLLDELEKLALTTKGGTELSPAEKSEWDRLNSELHKLWTTEEFTREYEKQGANGMNATTDTELTKYFVSLPKNSFEFWCKMESARLRDPVMRQFYQERDVVLEERRMRTDDSGDGRLYEALLQTAFTTHPYKNPVIGYRSDIGRVTATDVENFRGRYYVPSNIVVALVGDIDVKRDLPMVERYFGTLPKQSAVTRDIPSEPAQAKEKSVTIQFPAEPLQVIGFKKPVYPHPDDPAISVATELLAGNPTSALYKKLVKEQRVAASVSIYEAPGDAYPNLWLFQLVPQAPHTNAELRQAFDREMSEFAKSLVKDSDLESAKHALLVDDLEKLRSNQGLAVTLASDELLHGSWRASSEWLKEVAKVSAQDIQRVVLKYARPENRTVAVLETGTAAKMAEAN